MTINDDLLYRHIGTQIKSIRKVLHISQEELAEKVGITRTSITNIERGFQKLPLHLLYEICEALNVETTAVLPAIKELSGVDSHNKPITPKIASFVENAFKDLKDDDN